MRRILSILCGLAILGLFADAHAVPGTVAFTGRLSTSSGPVNGTVNMTFTLYTAATAGSAVWTENRPTTNASNGLVYVDLGGATTLDDTVFDGAPLFLEIILGAEVLSPRVPIRSVPYAFRAATADSADRLGTIDPGDVVTAVTATGGITATRTGNAVSLSAPPLTGAAPIAVTGGTVGLTTCAGGQIYKMLGASWACAADASTTYTAVTNGGITVNGSSQIGLVTTCAAGQVLKAGAGGTWACANDTDTPYTAASGGGLAVIGAQFATDTTVQRRTATTNNMSCPAGQYMRTIAQSGQATCVPALQCTRVIGTPDAATDAVACATGHIVVGGGCSVSGTTGAVLDSYPGTDTQWFCRTAAGGTVAAYAICCDRRF